MARHKYKLTYFPTTQYRTLSRYDKKEFVEMLGKNNSTQIYTALCNNISLCVSRSHWLISPILLNTEQIVLKSAEHAVRGHHTMFSSFYTDKKFIVHFSPKQDKVLIFIGFKDLLSEWAVVFMHKTNTNTPPTPYVELSNLFNSYYIAENHG